MNAHATSTPAGDSAEARAIREVFGENGPYVTSTKSMTGHECWMAGASETVYSIIMMNEGFVAPCVNFVRPDEATSGLRIPSAAVETPLRLVLSNSFGFGGTNAALLLRAPDRA